MNHRPFTWYDWLLAGSPAVKKHGQDPRHRLANCGHPRALSSRWARTLGMWGRAEPGAIMKAAGATRMAYDLFKYRHRLITKAAWMRRDGLNNSAYFMVVGQVMIATFAHRRVSNHIAADKDLSSGAAAAWAVLRPAPKEKEDPMGILPVEAMLYYFAMENLFEETGMTAEGWMEAETQDSWMDRAKIWSKHGHSLVSLPRAALERYPVE